jgi:hypothetical protein
MSEDTGTETKRKYQPFEMPQLQVFSLCDQVIKDAGTGKFSLIGLFDRIVTHEFPIQVKAALFMSVVGGRGYIPLEFRHVNLSTGEWTVLGGAQFVINDPLVQVPLFSPIVLQFEKPGFTALEVIAGGEPFISRRLQAVLVQES